MDSPIEAIKSKLQIAEVVGSYLKLEKAGINMKARCPFHNERTPSFFVSPERGTFHCFGCNRGGDIFTFVEEIEGVEFKEALRVLAERSGVSLSKDISIASGTGRIRAVLAEAVSYYSRRLAESAEANKYLSGRGLSVESIDKFRIGFAPAGWRGLSDHLTKLKFALPDAEKAGLLVKGDKGYYDRFRGRIVFPFFDIGSRPIGFSARILPGVTEDADKQGKYINSPETILFHKSRVLYGISEANFGIREFDRTVLVEGQLDVVLSHQAGVTNVVGVSGTAFTQEHVALLKRFSDNLVVVLDADSAGFRGSEKVVRLAVAAGMHVSVVALPGAADPADIALESPEKLKTLMSKDQPFVDYALELVRTGFTNHIEMEKAVRELLYPTLADTYNEIEKDRALQDIAGLLAVAPDAARKDFEKWLGSRQSPVDASSEMAVNVKRIVPPPLELVAARLWGIAALLEKSKTQGESELASQIWQDLRAVLGPETFLTLGDKYAGERREDLIFEVETQYPDRGVLTQESTGLLERLRRESLKFQFSEAMDGLRLAELRKDEKLVNKWLTKCQEISKQLSQA